MRKGDERKQQILDTAEHIFYQKGYDATTVQDILDELRLSKGGFYHHFTSKDQLLELICEQKVEASHQAALKAVSECPGGAVARLNALYDKNGIWQDSSPDFIGLLIRVAYRPENLRMRERMKMLNIEKSLPLFDQIIREGIAEGVFYTPYPDTLGDLLLQLGSNLTDDMALILLESGGDSNDLMRILRKLELYRHAIERLLDAPFGSIQIFQMGRMAEICDAIWKNNH